MQCFTEHVCFIYWLLVTLVSNVSCLRASILMDVYSKLLVPHEYIVNAADSPRHTWTELILKRAFMGEPLRNIQRPLAGDLSVLCHMLELFMRLIEAEACSPGCDARYHPRPCFQASHSYREEIDEGVLQPKG